MTAVEHTFDFIGGYLCLDFANTVGGLPPDSPSQERLLSYPHLVAWSQQADLKSENEANDLLRMAASAPEEAARVLMRAHALREAIYGIFAAITTTTQPASSDLEVLNNELERGTAGARVAVTPEGFTWEWRQGAGQLDTMLGVVARSTATLLISAEHKLVRECANDACHWLFLDTTKNHRRRWCRANGCGNVMRVRKHRERQRSPLLNEG